MTDTPSKPDGVYREGESWCVYLGGQVVATETSSAAAWRRMDRLQEENTSPSEKRADYGWRMTGQR